MAGQVLKKSILNFCSKQLFPKTSHGGELKTEHLKTRRTTNHAKCKSLFFLSVFTWVEDGNGHNGWERRMKDALLQREDCNVICIDWAGGAKRLYEQSVGNTRLVGAEIAELVKFIINKNGGSKHLADRFYIIGFSLGGQIAGYAGKSLRDNGMLLGRITGKSREY